MKRKIIFFDIDRILINEKTYIVPDSSKEATKKAKENGLIVFINTVRPIIEIDDCLKELNFDGYICGCETYIEISNNKLYYRSLGASLSKLVVNKLRAYHMDAIDYALKHYEII